MQRCLETAVIAAQDDDLARSRRWFQKRQVCFGAEWQMFRRAKFDLLRYRVLHAA